MFLFSDSMHAANNCLIAINQSRFFTFVTTKRKRDFLNHSIFFFEITHFVTITKKILFLFYYFSNQPNKKLLSKRTSTTQAKTKRNNTRSESAKKQETGVILVISKNSRNRACFEY